MKKGPTSERHDNRLAKARKPPILIEELPRVPLQSPQNLPDRSGIYFVIDNAGRVWYIGKAETSIRDRIKNHSRLSDFKRKSVTAIAWEQQEGADCDAREKELIEVFHPPLNLQQNFNRLPESDLGLTPEQEVERFFRLPLQLKLIELELEALKPNVVTRCEQAGGKLQHSLGSITNQTYRSWSYSEAVELAAIRLKKLKKAEEEDGTATLKSVRITPVARLNAEVLSEEIGILLNHGPDNEDEIATAV